MRLSNAADTCSNTGLSCLPVSEEAGPLHAIIRQQEAARERKVDIHKFRQRLNWRCAPDLCQTIALISIVFVPRKRAPRANASRGGNNGCRAVFFAVSIAHGDARNSGAFNESRTARDSRTNCAACRSRSAFHHKKIFREFYL